MPIMTTNTMIFAFHTHYTRRLHLMFVSKFEYWKYGRSKSTGHIRTLLRTTALCCGDSDTQIIRTNYSISKLPSYSHSCGFVAHMPFVVRKYLLSGEIHFVVRVSPMCRCSYLQYTRRTHAYIFHTICIPKLDFWVRYDDTTTREWS